MLALKRRPLAFAALLVAACCAAGGPVAAQQPATPTPFQQLLQQAERGDAAAQVRVATGYLTSQTTQTGTPEQKQNNLAQALRWARAAANQNHAGGQNLLGILYEAGLGVPQNKVEAARLYQLSANQNFGSGLLNIGKAYARGSGVPQDFAEARRWLTKAADQNVSDAELFLGQMAEKGEGGPADLAAAANWYRRAAGRNNAGAQQALANSYLNGRGVTADPLLAYFWFNLAASRLNGPSQAMAVGHRDALVRRLSPEEVERAQTVARQWKPGNPVEAETELRRDLPLRAAVPGAAATAPTRAPSSSGTGFVVSAAGHVLTNAHVVAGCNEFRARIPGDAASPASLVARDQQNDLAVLKLDRPVTRIAQFRSGAGVRQGDNVVVYGFPLGSALAADGNLTAGHVSALAGLGNDSRMLQISAPVQPGNSGGPLVDGSGNVVGVVVSKLNALAVMRVTGDVPQNVNFAIKSNVARDFLEANGVEYKSAASGPALSTSDVGERLKRVTAKIECWR